MEKKIDGRATINHIAKFGEFLTRVKRAGHFVDSAKLELDNEHENAHYSCISGKLTFAADEWLDCIQYWPTATSNGRIADTAIIEILD